MYLINHITTDASQQQTMILPDGSRLTMALVYKPRQIGWFANFAWNNFALNGIRICDSPNLLRQFKNVITFGFACFTVGNREPTQQQDFASGASSLYILTAAEVQQYEALLSAAK